MWGSTGMPAALEAFDSEGKVVDRAESRVEYPRRKAGIAVSPHIHDED